jgi:myo-inositol-1-phosphate synthase
MGGSDLSREDKMRAIASLIAAVAMLSAGAPVVAAMPADGAAIARLVQQVDAVVVVKKGKKSKPRTTGTPTTPPPQPSQSY